MDKTQRLQNPRLNTQQGKTGDIKCHKDFSSSKKYNNAQIVVCYEVS